MNGKFKIQLNKKVLIGLVALITSISVGHVSADNYTYKSGHDSLQGWILPEVTHPDDNQPTEARIELGKQLFFDPRLSGDNNMSCATCHNPMLGWSDALPTAKGFQSQVLGRASPTIINSAYSSILMWDGRKKSLEDQATGPLEAAVEMHTDFDKLFTFLNNNAGYTKQFELAYPSEGINKVTLAKAIANYERTVISNDSPFDRWVQGDKQAMTKQQIKGFKLFVDSNKGNCAVCHSAPNFTDDGFHNLGLESFADAEPDVGRYSQKPIRLMKGAFKTPTLRNITDTAPYFHDGSANTLEEVMDHYILGGKVKTNTSPNLKALKLNKKEKAAIISFMRALSSEIPLVTLPNLPLE